MPNPNPIERANLDLDRIDAEIRRLQGERQKVVGFMEMYQRYATDAPMIVSTGGVTITLGPAVHKKDIVGNAVEAFLRQKNGPQPLSKIYEVLVEQGIKISGPDEKMKRQNLSGIIHRDARFHHVRDRGWWFADANGARKAEEPDLLGSGSSSH